MQHVVLVIHLILTVALIVVVLLQRSEGAGLAGPSASGMIPVRGTANLLTRITAVLAGAFMLTSLSLAVLAGMQPEKVSLAESIAAQESQMDDQPVAPLAGAIMDDVPVSGANRDKTIPADADNIPQ